MDVDPLEGSSSYDVTIKMEIKEEEEEDQYNNIGKNRRVSGWQLYMLWKLLDTNRDVANSLNRFTAEKKHAKKKWQEFSETLNSRSDGAQKDWRGWSKYWIDYKAKLKKKVQAMRSGFKDNSMTELDKKFLDIMGDSGLGSPEVQLGIPTDPIQNDYHALTTDEKYTSPESIQKHERPLLDPIPHPKSPPEVLDSPARSIKSLPRSPKPPSATKSFSRRRRRRELPMSQEAARRALVRSSQMHAEAAVRTSEALEKIVEVLTNIQKTAARFERHSFRALMELAQCVQSNQEPIEFNLTDAMMDPKTGMMVCLHCLEDFDATLLSDHMINVHNYRRVLFKCHICLNTFQERKLLDIHKLECRPEQKVRKRKTFQQIMRDVESKYLMDDQDLLETVACPICLLDLPKYCLKEHLLNEHRKPDVILTCGRCNRNFKSKLTLREHVKLVHEAVEDSEECELCGQKFRSLKYLSNHKRNVHPSGNKIHKCDVCGKEFKSRLCLHQHCKYVHPPQSAMVECPHCPKKMFKSRINLQQHLKVSHGWKKK